MTTRAELREQIRTRLPDAVTWPDATLNAWIDLAIREYSNHFPMTQTLSFAMVAGQRQVELSFSREIRNVLVVEYPAGMNPPRYLKRKSRVSEGFVGAPVYDVFVDTYMDTPVLELGETPLAGESTAVFIETTHAIPTGDVYELTMVDNHLEALRLYVIWLGIQMLENKRAAGATTEVDAVFLAELSRSAAKAEKSYRAKIWDLRNAEGAGGGTKAWVHDSERIY